ncbi:MAG: mitochondrial fission ELM1 family protein [SAR86 cluster bacterium]|uniref:Mitochondrial fission ELM1 family protein n=1 Tax=SAR86 cluster bacterium TaxID=2030880 RepID=A0A838Y6K7_9GAMM|nr:mitochondrial fission ELM1 family protein [SAR86 cluster bacterium]
MCPSRNITAFDLICAPEHDFIKRIVPKNVITYQGALASPSFTASDDKKAIIAIGGKSKHYKFVEEVVLMQLQYVLNIHPNHDFKIFNSRRTPQSLNARIEDELKNFSNARFIDINHPNDVSFDASLNESSLKFVTPDSANLVFESLSTHGKTYLIQIESPSYRRWFGSKKIRSTMNELVISKRVGVVSLLAKKNNLNISKIENPHPFLEPLAEVEKVSFAIQKYLRD